VTRAQAALPRSYLGHRFPTLAAPPRIAAAKPDRDHDRVLTVTLLGDNVLHDRSLHAKQRRPNPCLSQPSLVLLIELSSSRKW
jgi:hypothetical protein